VLRWDGLIVGERFVTPRMWPATAPELSEALCCRPPFRRLLAMPTPRGHTVATER